MLGLGPHGHLRSAGRDKDGGRQRARGDGKQDPAVDLKGVVGARDVVEAEAARDCVPLAARGAQVPLDHMAPDRATSTSGQTPAPCCTPWPGAKGGSKYKIRAPCGENYGGILGPIAVSSTYFSLRINSKMAYRGKGLLKQTDLMHVGDCTHLPRNRMSQR